MEEKFKKQKQADIVSAEEKKGKAGLEAIKRRKWEEPKIILNYVPCALYTADLFDALMIYKKLWKDIGESKYQICTNSDAE